jgi:hypothetical protein
VTRRTRRGLSAPAVLTDNGIYFTTPGNTSSAAPDIKAAREARELVRAHAFEYACAQNDIDHGLTKPKRDLLGTLAAMRLSCSNPIRPHQLLSLKVSRELFPPRISGPEPSTWSMMLLGPAGRGFAGYRGTARHT